jgi:hypothetical protein
MNIFNDAIEQAYTEGFTGVRAAAEMSWVLDQRPRIAVTDEGYPWWKRLLKTAGVSMAKGTCPATS